MVVTYPAPSGAPTSTDYIVFADTQSVPVYTAGTSTFNQQNHPYYFCSFDFTGQARVTVYSSRYPLTANALLEPLESGIVPSVVGGTMTFVVTSSGQYTVMPQGISNLLRVLHIFANPIEAPPTGSNVRVLTGFPPVQNLITVGANEILYVDGGAFIRANIRTTGAGARICGRGILDTSPWPHFSGPSGVANPFIFANGTVGSPIRVEGVVLRHGWRATAVVRSNVILSNVKICSSQQTNDDAVSIEGANVLVENCFIRSDDDCVTTKNQCENITVRNCQLWCDRARNIMLGPESSGLYQRNFLMENLLLFRHIVTESNEGELCIGCPAIALQAGGPDSHYSSITIRNVRVVSEPRSSGLNYIQVATVVQPLWGVNYPGYVDGPILLENISYTGGQATASVRVEGYDSDHLVQNVTFRAVSRHGVPVTRTSPNVTVNANTRNIVFDTGTVTNAPPTVSLTSPVNNSTYTAPATVNLAATASDADGSIARVEFWTGATVLNADTASPYAYSWAGVGAGSYALRAIAYDSQGGTSTSAVVNITVYSSGTPVNQPPAVTLTSPVNGSTYTAPASITMIAQATDSDGGIAVVRFYQGTTMVGQDSTSPYDHTWTNVSSGTYQLRAVAQDTQGAVSTSAVVSVTVYPPNQPPVVSLTSPVNNSTYTAPATIQLTASATDSDGSIANVRFYRGSTLLATDTASPYEYTWINVSSGTYQLRAVAQDNQGATSTSTVVTVTVLSSSTPAVWYTLTTAANPANGGTVTPASGTYLAGSQIQVTATPNANYTFATWSGDASGTNPTVTLTMDSNKSIVAHFTYVPPANSSPVVNITSPNDGATYTAPASITITATATDSDGSIAAVRFYAGTTLLATDSTSPYEYTWAGVPAGSYVLTAQAVDNGGGVGISPAVSVTVNPVPQPTQPELRAGEVRIVTDNGSYLDVAGGETAVIRFRAMRAGRVDVKVYDLKGRLLWNSFENTDGVNPATVWWPGTVTGSAEKAASGVYLVMVKGAGVDSRLKIAVRR